MPKKSKAKKKKSFVLSDEELDRVTGGSGPAGVRLKKIVVTQGISGGATVTERFDGPRPVNRAPGKAFGGGEQM